MQINAAEDVYAKKNFPVITHLATHFPTGTRFPLTAASQQTQPFSNLVSSVYTGGQDLE